MARIELQHVSVEFPLYEFSARSLKKQFLRLTTGGQVNQDANKHVVVNALNNVSLVFEHGDRVGLIGHNGAGKSTLLRLLAGIYEPTRGEINIDGRVCPMLDLMLGIEADLTGYENIVMRGIILGLTRKEILARVKEISDFTGLGDYLAMPIRTYSSGMMVRLAFAISASIVPDILIIDEIFGTADAAFMEQARQKMVTLLDQSSVVVMATHAEDLIKEFCNKCVLMEAGQIKFIGNTTEALELYYKTLHVK